MYIVLLTLYSLLFVAACAKTFLVSKECKTYFFGSADEGLYTLLCASGDFTKILDDSGLPQDVKDGLYKAQCVERSKAEVDELYTTLTPDQKEKLKFAFVKHGYEINYKPLPNYQYDNYIDNINFCPTDSRY